MSKTSYLTLIKLIIIVAILFAICFSLCFIPKNNIVEAEINTDVKIQLQDDSIYDACNDVFAYTKGTTLSLVMNNKNLNFANAISGQNAKAIDIALTTNSIAILYTYENKDNQLKTGLNYFNYATSIRKQELIEFFDDIPYKNLFATENEIYWQTADEIGILVPDALDSDHAQSKGGKFFGNVDFDDFVIHKTHNDILALIGYKDSSLYYTIVSNLSNASTLAAAKVNECSLTFTNIDLEKGNLYGIANNSVYSMQIDEANKTITTFNSLLTINEENVNIVKCVTSSNEENVVYVLSHETTSIKKYIYQDEQLVYFNTFDNKDYDNPSSFEILKVYKMDISTSLYMTPKNLQVLQTIPSQSYVLVLAKQDNFLYISTQDGLTGYIKENTPITEIPEKSNNTPIGQYAQALHPNTEDTKYPIMVYKYPYASSELLSSISIYEQLNIIDNVAEENETQVWNWYKISYYSENKIITGYVKVDEVCKYTPLSAPKILKTVKVKTLALGETVNIYSLPSEESPVVSILTDGSELDLAETYNENSEWTKVLYNDITCYVKTSDIQKGGLTSLQISIIVIVCVTFVSTIVVFAIIYKRKKYN